MIGYLGFALFVVQLAAWAVILGSAVYLLMAAVDDIAVTVFTRDSPAGRILSRALGVRGTLIDQFGVLLSGIVRVMLAIAAEPVRAGSTGRDDATSTSHFSCTLGGRPCGMMSETVEALPDGAGGREESVGFAEIEGHGGQHAPGASLDLGVPTLQRIDRFRP